MLDLRARSFVGDEMVSLNPFRRRSSSTGQTIPRAANGCTCKRCNCPHPPEQYHSVKKNALGYEQVFCEACNDICLTHPT